MKNRILVFLLLAILTLSLLCSCKKEHTHDFSGDFSTDDTYHWHQCECGEKDGYEQHSWNSGVVTVKPTVESEGERTYTCSVCRGKKTEVIEKLGQNHTHVYDIIGSDENNHWNECVCGEKSEQTAHTWDEGKITLYPTVEEEGIRTFTCTVCEYERNESIEKIDPDHTHAFNTPAQDARVLPT